MQPIRDKILLVEDDFVLGYVVKEFLQKHNFEVCLCMNAEDGWRNFMKNKYSICLIDILMPGKKNGIDLTKNIRSRNINIPIILLSSKNSCEDIQEGFKNGADNYLTKPYNLEELLMRIQVFLKRPMKEKKIAIAPIPVGDFIFDYENLTLTDDKEEFVLTAREAEMIYYFCQNANRLIKREDILTALWGKDDSFNGRSLDVFVVRIRKYLKSQTKVKLETIHRIGYKFRHNILEQSLSLQN